MDVESVFAIISWVLIIGNDALVVEIKAISELQGTMAAFPTHSDCDDILIGVWNRWGKHENGERGSYSIDSLHEQPNCHQSANHRPNLP